MLQTIIEILDSINIFYFSLLILFGFFGVIKYKRNYTIIKDKGKFVILVPSHNEASIISATIKNLGGISYDKSLFEIYILADNCKDETVSVAKKTITELGLLNFFVLERKEKDPLKRGKPHAIRWAIEKLENQNHFYNYFDLFLILDADNFVNSDILTNFNSHYYSYEEVNRPVMIQCYLDCKNTNGLIAKGYHISYRILNRFNQLGRSRLGLNALIGGTGFIMNLQFLKSLGGFKAQSLTEDLEIQTIATLMNKRIAYNHYIRVYDEKPTRIRSSVIQKTRWSQGHWWNFFFYGWKALLNMMKSLLNPSDFIRSFDIYIYLSIMINYVILLLSFSLKFIVFILGASVYLNIFFYLNTLLLSISFFIFYPVAMFLDGTVSERKRLFIDWIPNYFAFVFSSFIYLFAGLIGLFKHKNQKVWIKTQHSVNQVDI